MIVDTDLHHVLLVQDENSKKVFHLRDKFYSLGRDRHNHIILDDPVVSRHHGTLVREQETENNHAYYRINDGDLQGNKSRNGLIINGKLTKTKKLNHGDVIFFGGKTRASYYIFSNPSLLYFLVDKLESQTAEKEVFSKATIPSLDYPENLKEIDKEELIRLASFPELSPTPIIEINYEGEITYINAAGIFKFKDILIAKTEHPVLAGLIPENKNQHGGLIRREIQIENEYFDEYIHYLVERKLIRIYLFDLTQRRQAEEALLESEARYRAIVRQVSEGICILDIDSYQIIDANTAYCQLLGYCFTQIKEIKFTEIIEYPENFSLQIEEFKANNSYFFGEVKQRCRDGRLIAVEINLSCIYYHNQKVLCCTARDITQRQRDEQLLKFQAFHDPLTGLTNRIRFEKQLDTTISNAKVNNTTIAVMFLDIDDFAHTNNTLGHPIGDKLLQAFAERLQLCLRADDLASRWGGDEFTIVLPSVHELNDVTKLAIRILESLAEPLTILSYEVQIRTSIGIALYPQDGEDRETLTKNADLALLQAKNEGKNNYQFYSPSL